MKKVLRRIYLLISLIVILFFTNYFDIYYYVVPMVLVLIVMFYGFRNRKYELISVGPEALNISRYGIGNTYLFAEEINLITFKDLQNDEFIGVIRTTTDKSYLVRITNDFYKRILDFAERHNIEHYKKSK